MRKLLLYSLPVQVLFFHLLKKNTVWIEKYYIPYIFEPITTALRSITRLLPFSLGLLMAYAAVIYLVIFLITARKKKGKELLVAALSLLAPIYFYYQITWGILYYREPISTKLNYDELPATTDELRELCVDLVKETNNKRAKISDEQLSALTYEKAFQMAPKFYQNLNLSFLNYTTPSIKLAAGSPLLAYMGTSGIYTFWTGEANINSINIAADLPGVTLHEMAHQMGIASEDEANYCAWLAGKNASNPLFEYSAYYHVVWRALRRLNTVDSTVAKNLYAQLDSSVINDARKDQLRWKKYRNPIQAKLIAPFYNLFLKANGSEYGIMSYDRVIDLIIYERRSARSPKDPRGTVIF
jgi:hypothetical protein